MDQNELERLSRNELIQRARRLGVERAELMTRIELRDEIVRLSEPDVVRRKRVRGWLGVARDLLANVVDKGLHLPEAAALIRGDLGIDFGAKPHRPVATVTLSEIYAAQGHVTRAVELLDEVLAREPDHEAARELADRLKGDLEQRAATAALRAEQRKSGAVLGRVPFAQAEERSVEAPAAALGGEPTLADTDDAAPVEAEAEPVEAVPEPVEAVPEPVEAAPDPHVGSAEHEPAPLPEIDRGWEPEPAPRLDVAAELAFVLERSDPAPVQAYASGSDLLVAIPCGPSGTFVYWELHPESVERARRRVPGGRAMVRVVALEPSWDGAKRKECEIDAEPLIGSAMLDGFAETAVIRAALGWRSPGGFRPLELGIVVVSSEGADLGDQPLEVQWAPSGAYDRTKPLELARGRLLDRLQAR